MLRTISCQAASAVLCLGALSAASLVSGEQGAHHRHEHGEQTATIHLLSPARSSAHKASVKVASPADANVILSSYLRIPEYEHLREGLDIPEQAIFSGEHFKDGVEATAQPLLIVADKLGPKGSIEDYVSPSILSSLDDLLLEVSGAPAADSWRALLAAYTQRLKTKFGYFTSSQNSNDETLDKRFLLPGSLNLEYAVGEGLGQDEVYGDFLASIAELAALEVSETPKNGFVHLTGLGRIAHKFGRQSSELQEAKEMLRLSVDSIVSTRKGKTAFLLVPGSHHAEGQKKRRSLTSPLAPFDTRPYAEKRADKPSVKPIVTTTGHCFDSASSCSNATNACSGHGSCVQALRVGSLDSNCYVCQCKVTQDDKKRNRYWSGDQCQKEDMSSPFFLIAGSTLLLLFVGVASVVLLAKVGSEPLPSTLAALGGAASGHHKRD